MDIQKLNQAIDEAIRAIDNLKEGNYIEVTIKITY